MGERARKRPGSPFPGRSTQSPPRGVGRRRLRVELGAVDPVEGRAADGRGYDGAARDRARRAVADRRRDGRRRASAGSGISPFSSRPPSRPPASRSTWTAHGRTSPSGSAPPTASARARVPPSVSSRPASMGAGRAPEREVTMVQTFGGRRADLAQAPALAEAGRVHTHVERSVSRTLDARWSDRRPTVPPSSRGLAGVGLALTAAWRGAAARSAPAPCPTGSRSG